MTLEYRAGLRSIRRRFAEGTVVTLALASCPSDKHRLTVLLLESGLCHRLGSAGDLAPLGVHEPIGTSLPPVLDDPSEAPALMLGVLDRSLDPRRLAESDRGVASGPLCPEAAAWRGTVLFARFRYRDARRYLREVPLEHRCGHWCALLLAETWGREVKFGREASVLATLSQLGTGHALLRSREALAWLRDGSPQQALEALAQIPSLGADGWLLTGLARTSLGDASGACLAMRRCLELSPDSKEAGFHAIAPAWYARDWSLLVQALHVLLRARATPSAPPMPMVDAPVAGQLSQIIEALACQ